MDLKLDGMVAACATYSSRLTGSLIRAFGREGVAVGVFGPDPDRLHSWLESAPGPAIAVEGEPGRPPDHETFRSDLREAFGQVDLLLVELPPGNETEFAGTPAHQLSEPLRPGMIGPLSLIRGFLPHLASAEHPGVVLIAEASAGRSEPSMQGYGSQAMIRSLPILARMLEPHGVRVNAMKFELNRPEGQDGTGAMDQILEPAANTALFLCSPATEGLSGSLLNVRTMRSDGS